MDNFVTIKPVYKPHKEQFHFRVYKHLNSKSYNQYTDISNNNTVFKHINSHLAEFPSTDWKSSSSVTS